MPSKSRKRLISLAERVSGGRFRCRFGIIKLIEPDSEWHPLDFLIHILIDGRLSTGIEWHDIAPGKAMQNGFVERLASPPAGVVTGATSCSARRWIGQAGSILARRRDDFDTERPRSSLQPQGRRRYVSHSLRRQTG
ncbi:integrase core domain-containing protein [Sphingomonas sp. MMS24-J45]|uniref:integrase core domain-containing protein n=1 Tax=Sphingomonas sp. MMS24-J45 TaxID=3238806 RepID=UPI00385131D2